MPIDPESEEILPLKDAAKYVKRKYGGDEPHINTLIRWCSKGLKGRRLESIKRGSTRLTTRQAIARFFAAGGDPATAARQLETDRARQAQAKLIAEGF